MSSLPRDLSSPSNEPGRILRPSERFANTGAFGDNGVFGQGGSLASYKPTYSALSPINTPSSTSSASLATPGSTAPSSRLASPTAIKSGIHLLADKTRLDFLDFEPIAANPYALPPGAASGRNDIPGTFNLSGSLAFKDPPVPPRASDLASSSETKQSPCASQTPPKKKFFSFGRNINKKDFSSSASSDDEGPPLSETPNKRFSRFSRSFSSGTPSSSIGKRSKSAGPGPRPSITSFESNGSTIKQLVPRSSSSTLNDEWILLQKRDPSLPKHREHALPPTDEPDALERLIASPRSEKADTRDQAVVMTPPPPLTKAALPVTPVQLPQAQVAKPSLPALPTSPPFYPASAPRNQPRASAGHPSGSPAFLNAATARIPTSAGSANMSDPFGPLVAPKSARRQSQSAEAEKGRKERQLNPVSPVGPPPIPKSTLESAMTFPQAKRKIHSPVLGDTGKSASPQNATSRRQSSVPPKPIPNAQVRHNDLRFGEGGVPARPSLALTAQNLSAGTQPASPASEARAEPEIACNGKPRFEEALAEHQQILVSILDYLDFPTFRSICRTSRVLRQAFSQPSAIELACERFIGSFGYRTLSSGKAQKASLSFTLRDLDAFYASTEYSLMDHAVIAADHKRSPLSLPMQRKVRAATRAHSKLVLRLRMQSTLSGLQLSVPRWANAGLQGSSDLYKSGRASVLRVWVPTATTWMTNEELEECEREIHRAGLWESLQRGDLLRNVAVSDIANEGLVIFDGKYLRDLSHVHDRLGHLPSWLNGLAFSPSYFHNLISCTNGEPVIYLDLTPFLVALSSNITLCKEKTALTSPGGERYAVNRYVYRTACDLVPGTLLGNAGQQGGAGPGGIEVLHPDWGGKLVIETEGTAEAARALLERATPVKKDILPNQPRLPAYVNNHPYRILRSLSRPGQIWVVPLYEETAKQGRQRS